MKRLKVLVYGDQNLNIMDGSAIWFTSLANILTSDGTVDLSILLKTPIKRKQVISNIAHLDYINLINPFELKLKRIRTGDKKLSPKQASKIIALLDKQNNYDIIITRGKELTQFCLNEKFSRKLIPYITDFNYQKKHSKDMKFFKIMYKKSLGVFVQTEQMKDLLVKNLKVSKRKFITLPPTVNDVSEMPRIGYRSFSIVYTGKFAEKWETKAMYDSFLEAKEKIDALTLNIAGDKFQGSLSEKKDDIIYKFENTKGINWIGAVSREKSLELVRKSDIGFAYRSKEIDNDDSVELSTKFLEYGINGKPVVVRKIKQYVKLLGEDYPLYCNSYKELVEKLVLAFTNEEVYKKAATACYEVSKKFQFSIVSKQILGRLKELKKSRTTILFAGHDFKFLNWYIEHCEKSKKYNVLIDKWSGHNSHDYDKSMELLKQADIVFCEWGLGNAEFYSNNLLRGQQLYIRVHRQELTTNYLDNVNYDKVTKVIAISPHIFEEFNRVKKVPRDKMTIIPNMVDVDRFKLPKKPNTKYHIGILGVLPKLKRLDRAVNILEKLWEVDPRYKLFIKSKLPEDLPWMKNRPEELKYYDQIFKKIENAPWKNNVIFDKHGDDVAEWFSNVNFILSTSEIESFHLAPMEGMSSGTIPVIFNWPGAETLYPDRNIVRTEEEAVDFILKETKQRSTTAQEYEKLVRKYDLQTTIKRLDNLIFSE